MQIESDGILHTIPIRWPCSSLMVLAEEGTTHKSHRSMTTVASVNSILQLRFCCWHVLQQGRNIQFHPSDVYKPATSLPVTIVHKFPDDRIGIFLPIQNPYK